MSEGPRGAREAEHESLGDLAYLRIQCQALRLPFKEGTKSEPHRMRISFPYNTFLRRKGRFSLRNRPVNAAIMMLQYSGTAKLKVEG
jgi:hypothetical protein